MSSYSTASEQLHRAQVAHQDLKPSNVLVFPTAAGSKICDLGRAWDRDQAAPHDSCDIAGDRTYAPIESLYGVVHSDEQRRRFGCDMYHLGSLMAFLFSRIHMNGLITSNLPQCNHPSFWPGTYAEVLPFVQSAFDAGVSDFSTAVAKEIRNDLSIALSQLCNPDYEKRGHPGNYGLNKLSLERYITKFDLLANRLLVAGL